MKMRKLVVFLATAMLVLPLAAFALGFGSIKLNSVLGEPFDAEIELLSPTPDDITNLKVKLASPDAFLRAGIDRPAFLTDLQFAVKQRDNGSYYMHITSRKPIREPFLDVLLEMDWQNGRMLREYTVLLDPPALKKQQTTVVEVPPTAPQPAAPHAAAEPAESPFLPEPTRVSEAPAMPEPVPALIPEPVPAVEPEFALAEGEKLPRISVDEVEPAPPVQARPEPAPIPEPAPAPAGEEAAAPLPTPAEAPQMAMAPEAAVFEDSEELFPRIPIGGHAEPLGELDYGIVRKGDNLWTIAEKLRHDDSFSIYQVMMALLRNNPDAFVDGNVNRLKVGHVLRIDDPGMLTRISKQEAAREYQAQTRAWEEYRQQVARSAAPQPIVASEAEPAVEAAPAPAAELTLASPDGSELQGGTGTSEQAEAASNDILTLQDEVRQLRESAAVAGGRNEELNARLREMETELERMQRAVTVKDDELAAMQQQMAQLQEQAAAAEALPAPATEEAGPATEPVTETAPAEPVSEQAAEPAPPAKSPVELAEEIARQEKATASPAAPAPAATEEGLLDKVMGFMKVVGDSLAGVFGGLAGGSLLTFVALPVVLVLLLLMIILVRRRRKAEAYQESILTGGPSSVTGAAAAAEESEEESSFLSDFAVSGAGAIQTEDSEVDPLTEADVFIAYGRYEAAEERLKEAIQKDPQRAELKLKLLELYHTTKNKPAFENAAEEFYASLGDNANDNPMWQKVVSMGAELIPGNPMFSGAAVAGGAALADMAATQDPGVGLSDSQVMDIGLDTGVFDAADMGTSPPQPAAGGDMDFSLDMGEGSAPASEAGAETDFNLGLEEAAVSAPASEAGAGSDLDFSLDLDETPAPSVTEEVAAVAEGGLDFNLDMGDSGSAEQAGADAGLDFNLETEETTPAASEEAGSLDFDLDLAAAGSDDTAEFNLDMAGDLDLNDAAMAVDLGSTPGGDVGVESSSGTPEPTMDLELDASEAGDLDIGSSDEVGTKLDLAKAYIDMGDPDGARSILDEVMDEGNDSQKQEAQELLQQIA